MLCDNPGVNVFYSNKLPRTFDELFPALPNRSSIECTAAIILLISSIGNHWVSLIYDRHTNRISYYDPYNFDIEQDFEMAKIPDKTLVDLIRAKITNANKSSVPLYIELKSGIRNQSLRKNITTCGVHSALRCVFWGLSNAEFNEALSDFCDRHKMNADQAAVSMCLVPLMRLL